MNKRGQPHYEIIFALVIGLLVLGLGLYYIFQEYFDQDNLSWEGCKQSILIRSGTPINGLKMAQEAFFDFKCKTQVININFKDKAKAEKIIADTMVMCWNTYANGKSLFAKNTFFDEKACFHCARIHFTENVKDYYLMHKYVTGPDGNPVLLGSSHAKGIELSNYLQRNMPNKQQTYQDYLYGIGDGYKQIANDAFFKSNTADVFFPEVIESNRGDIVITVIHKIGTTVTAWLTQSNSGTITTVVPWFAEVDGSKLNCDVSPVIPA